MRRLAAVMGVLFLLLAVRAVASTMDGIMVSGQNDLLVIDTNGDHMPDYMDCHAMASTNVSGDLLITTMQMGGTPIRACSGGGEYMGHFDDPSTFLTDTSISGKIDMSNIVGGIGMGVGFDGTFAPQGGGAGGGGGAAATEPRTVTRVELTSDDTVIGSGLICDSIARVTLANGMPIAVGLLMDVPGFLHVQGVPFQTLGSPPTFVFLDVFIPKKDGVVTFSLASAPNDILVQILLAGTCGRGAPTLSQMNLIVLALALLAAGAWVLGRRPKFSEALPLP